LPGIFGALAPVLDNYGYLAVGGLLFLEDFGVPAPGETILIAAAVYAGAGQLNIVAVVLIGFVAAVAGDNVGFAIGRFGGRALVLRFGRYVSSPRTGWPRPRRSSPATAGRSSRSPGSSRGCGRPTGSSPGWPGWRGYGSSGSTHSVRRCGSRPGARWGSSPATT